MAKFWFRKKGTEINAGPQASSPSSGVSAGFSESMGVSAFWASVRLLTEAVAAMPLRCYKTEGGIKKQVADYGIYELLNRAPNRYQTRTEFFESIMINLVVTGNSYCLKQTAGSRIVSLMPLSASKMTPIVLPDGSIDYEFIDMNAKTHHYSESQIWHVKLFGNGIVGLSPMEHASKALVSAISENKRSESLSKNGGKKGGYIETPQGTILKAEQRNEIRKELQKMVSGDDDFLPVLEMGAKFVPTTLSPADTKLLESRRFSIEDIARFMGVPSVLINDTAGSTVWGSGIGQIMEGFYKLNLRPYLERIESSIKRHLMPKADFDSISIEFDFDSLLRADRTSRIETNGKAINSGQITPNEARLSEGLEPKEGGDDIYLNGSLVKAGQNTTDNAATQSKSESEKKDEEV